MLWCSIVSKSRILLELPKLARGELEKIPNAEQFSCSTITIDCNKKQSFNLDGEVFGETPTTFSIKRNALNVFCPK
jgi:diacylglycerol kinase family enzyme